MRPVPKPPRRLSGALFPSFGRAKDGRGLGAGAPRNELIEQILFYQGALSASPTSALNFCLKIGRGKMPLLPLPIFIQAVLFYLPPAAPTSSLLVPNNV